MTYTNRLAHTQWLQVGSAIEIANHHYEGNFELKEFKTDLVNGIFYFFNFGKVTPPKNAKVPP